MTLEVACFMLVAISASALQCGVPAVQPQLIDLNIIGGQEVIPKSFPWHAGLYEKPDWNIPPFNHGEHFCGGVLVDDRTVLTAAHCLIFYPTEFRVHLGAHVRSAKDDGEIYAEVDHFCRHPNFSAPRANDIGIVRLARAVKLTDSIRPICLPKANEGVRRNDKLYVTGWGYTSNGIDQRASEVLMQARQAQITKARCEAMQRVNAEKLICTVHTYGSSCQGDSGGPLMTQRGRYWQLQGLVSGGPPICGTPGWPMYYTEVSRYVDWITKYRRSPDPTADGNICGVFPPPEITTEEYSEVLEHY